MRPKEKCERCGRKYNLRSLRKWKGRFLCHYCLKKERIGMPNLNPEKSLNTLKRKDEEKDKRLEQRRLRKLENPPKIKGSVRRTNNKNNYLYITREEKRVLYKKYLMNMSPSESSRKVNEICDFLSKLVKRMKEHNIKEEEISRRFKEEWAKLIQQETPQIVVNPKSI